MKRFTTARGAPTLIKHEHHAWNGGTSAALRASFGACIAAALLACAGRPVFAVSPAPAKEPLAASRAPHTAAPSAIVVPRSSCGTSWTAWVKDPNADLNPCPKGCQRGNRLKLDEHKSGDSTEYQANYECYLPQLEVPQPAPITRAAGAPPRQNCGTMWTGWQSDPSSPANPCPANCARGELRAVNRSLSNGKLAYDMNYQCYVEGREPSRAQPTPRAIAARPTVERPKGTFDDEHASLAIKGAAPGPELTAVTATSMSMITAEWRPAPGATSYRVQAVESGSNRRSTSPEYAAKPAASAMFGAVARLTPGFPYDIWVEAIYPDRRVGVSAIKRISTLDPVNPSGLTATLVSSGSVRLAWQPLNGAVKYHVEGSQLPGGVDTVETTAMIDNVPMGRNEWRVVAMYRQGVFNDRHPAVVVLILGSAASDESGPAASSGSKPLAAVGGAIKGLVHNVGSGIKGASEKVGKGLSSTMHKVGKAIHDLFN